MRTRNRLLVPLALAAFVLSASLPAPALAVAHPGVAAKPKTTATRVAGPKVASGHGILVDAQTGAIMWSRRANASRPPASLTKMLTALLVRASLPPGAVVVGNKDAARTPPTRLGLRPGQKITVGQALAAMMVLSANDMAALMADETAGSQPRFEQAMNLASRRLGLRQSSWHSPNGLPVKGHVSSAYDLAILARAVLRDPWLARIVRTGRLAFITPDHQRHTIYAHSAFLKLYKGAVGVKTGYTDAAGRCLAAAATRNGRTLIAIVLHGPNPPADAIQLMNWGFGAGRSVTTGQVLPPYVATPSVRSLLAPPPTTTLEPVGGASAAKPGSGSALLGRLRGDALLPVGIGASAGVVLLAGTGLALRRRRRRPTMFD